MVGFTEEPAAVRSGPIDVDRPLDRDSRVMEQPTSDPQALPSEKFDRDAETVTAAATPAGPSVKAGAVTSEDFLDKHDKKEPVGPRVSFFALFKYANAYDYLLMTLTFLGAVGDGSSFSIMLALLGSLINSFGSHANGSSKQEFDQKVIDGTLALTYIAVGAFFCSFLEAACALRTADRQAAKMRTKYLRATLRQDVGFFDTAGANVAEVINSVGTDTLIVQDAIGEKYQEIHINGFIIRFWTSAWGLSLLPVNSGKGSSADIANPSLDFLAFARILVKSVALIGNFVMNTSSFIAGFAVAFYLEWRLAMVIVAFLPVLMIPGLLYGRALIGLARAMQSATLKAASVAEESLSSIRTVYSFVGEQRTVTAYSHALDLTVKAGMKMGLAKGLATGANGVTFVLWAVMAWYGSLLIIQRGLGGGTVLVCGLAAMMGGLGLGTALPNLRYIAEAQMAALRMFTMIDRVPDIDSENAAGLTSKVTGALELRNVRFQYPSRPKQNVLEDFNLVIPAGKTVALVGASGSGKSTVIALLERYYDPTAGTVLVDGINIQDVQLRWLRAQIGLVSQEPSLFATTIRENILYGKEGASEEEIKAAAVAANAHTFISGLPKGYDTLVGEKGVQMSGGQKQRIAIARALLKNPPILLLDEATSALDSESERIVQVALDQAAVGRTTVIVAHRLSTIRTADLIAVVHAGRVIEIGSHEQLLQDEGGAYSALVNIQGSRPDDDGDHLHVVPAAIDDSSSVPSASQFGSSLSKRSSTSFRRDPSVRRSFTASDAASKLGDEPGVKLKSPSIGRLLKLNRPEWKQALLGCLGAAGFGFVQPGYAFTMGSMVSVFFETDHDKMRHSIRTFSLIFTALAVACLFTNVTRDYNFASMGERLTKRVRELLLTKVLTFEVAWFDEEEHSSSAVCSQLDTDAAVVRSLVGDRMSLLVQTGAAILLACILGLAVAWPLAIVMIVTQPISILCFYGKKVLLKRMSEGNLKAQTQSTVVASEAVSNHRTITAFSLQNAMLQRFTNAQNATKQGARTRALIAGLGLGSAQFCMLATWAFYFWYGARLINQGKISFPGMFKAFFVLVSTGRMIADAGSATSDLSKGSTSAAAIFGILDRTSRIKAEEGDLERVDGNVELKEVDFAYPMRPDAMVFKNFSLSVQAGQSIALVGQSGSGKSTIIGLIERFYDPLKGAVYIDSRDIRALPLRTLRRHIGLVGQEPTLFAGTIRENILYGKADATEAELIEAAKSANAHTFISGLASGYDTNTGDRGLQLSGGQKQRIAIARAIVKNPAVLLLDEATSALDSHSERVVQDALDRIMVGRTTIVVAHRLSTIQNADSIAVIQNGSVHEQGRHRDLMAKCGAYFELVKLQTKDHR